MSEESKPITDADKIDQYWPLVGAHRRACREVDRLEAENASLRARVDRTITAALRYESRHDRDPERVKLWQELKMALMVDAALPARPSEGEEKKDERCGRQLAHGICLKLIGHLGAHSDIPTPPLGGGSGGVSK